MWFGAVQVSRLGTVRTDCVFIVSLALEVLVDRETLGKYMMIE